MNKTNLESAIYLSAVALALGVFLPLTRLPIYGDVSYYRVAQFEALLVVLFAIAAPLLVYLKKKALLLLPPIAVWLTLLFPALKSLLTPEGKSGFFGQLGDSASAVMQDFAADLFLNIADFKWGGLIFIVGLLGLTASCTLRWLKK